MNRASILLIGFLSVSASFNAFSAKKIAYFDSQFAFAQSPELKTISEQLDKELGPRADSLRKENDLLMSDIHKVKSAAEKMKASDLRKAEEKLTARKHELQNKADNFIALRDERRKAASDSLMKKVKNAAREVAKENSYDMVIESHNVIYAEEIDNITDRVVNKLKKSI